MGVTHLQPQLNVLAEGGVLFPHRKVFLAKCVKPSTGPIIVKVIMNFGNWNLVKRNTREYLSVPRANTNVKDMLILVWWHHHSKNKVVKWTTLGLSNWCQKRTPQSRPKLVIWMSRRKTTLMSSQKQPESRQMTTFFTGFSAIWRLSYHLRTTEWQTSNRQMMVLWLICDKL